MLREMRLTHLLHAGSGFDEAVSYADIVHAAAGTGREVLDGEAAGWLGEDAAADLLLIDRARFMADLVVDAEQDLTMLAARAIAPHVSHLIVAGREVVRDGTVLGIDLAAAERELSTQARARAPNQASLDFVEQQRARLQAFYEGGQHLRAGTGD
jgi:cytosine/adenosine deaminase-related metal-dependent hydrolase